MTLLLAAALPWISSPLFWIPAALAGIFLVPWILGPVLVYVSHWESSQPEMSAAAPESLPPDVRAFFDASFPTLADAGFTEARRWRLCRFAPNIDAEICVMVHRGRNIVVAGSALIVTAPGMSHLSRKSIEFVSRFEDGEVIDTLNIDLPVPFRRLGRKRIFQVPQARDPLTLLRVHEGILGLEGGGRRTVPAPPPDELPLRFLDSLREDLETKIAMGLSRRVAGSPMVRLTVKGAVILTWMNVWPVSWMRRRAMWRHGEEWMARFGVKT